MHPYIKLLLLPFALLYGLIVFFRNQLYGYKIFKSKEFHLPVISVGNITVGGTGKTPHTEYLIRLLKDKYNVAFLSRGYKRKTRNFIVATENSSAEVIGDEPRQIKQKFPELTVAVDRDRVNGIEKLTENIPELDVILLDDAYQHRSVNPGVNILLIDYNQPLQGDFLLPYGRLREPASQRKRANIIIFSKVPRNITPMDKRLFLMNVAAHSHQTVYFTTLAYGGLKPVFTSNSAKTPDLKSKDMKVVLVTGIADPSLILKELIVSCKEVIPIRFPDHYTFKQSDINAVIERYTNISGDNKIIITTEKDAARLSSFDIPENIPEAWFYMPVEIEFLSNDAEHFNQQIFHYVNNNSKNSILYKK
jgi:tetraacyldisaccharide 4'-kinase